MQNVVHNSKCDSLRDSEINESIKDHSRSSSPLSGNLNVERGPSVTSLQTHFMAEVSESEEDDVSDVESFILEQGDIDEEPGLDSSKFLLRDDVSESGIDVETQCRIEALLEASSHLFENGQLDAAG
ncbi:ankyrin repeat domain-containing protein 17, partial [Parasteatoda tepidariorum]|uniref:ankyrin repeat domain-containing protein 17 n=1 Tax=Parasteatoda tepidariorum TaxID=114398 RepID=UPI001C7254C6